MSAVSNPSNDLLNWQGEPIFVTLYSHSLTLPRIWERRQETYHRKTTLSKCTSL